MGRAGKRFILLFLTLLLIVSNFVNISTYEASSIEEKEEKIEELNQKKQELKKNEKSINEKKNETSEKIKQNTNKQSSIQTELEALEESLQTTENQISDKESKIASLQNEINSLQDQVHDTEGKIDELHKQIEELHSEIEEVTLRMEKREDLLRERLRSMQFTGGEITYLEVFLGAKSFTDLIGRVVAVNTIVRQDQVLIDEHKTDRETLETNVIIVSDKQVDLKDQKKKLIAKKEEIEESKNLVEIEKEKLVSLKLELAAQSQERTNLLAQLQVEEEELREYEISLEEEQKIIAAQAAVIEKARQLAEKEKDRLIQLAKEEEERKKREEEENKAGDGEVDDGNTAPPQPSGDRFLLRPTTGRFTSGYGMRPHPTLGGYRMHSGLDIANSTGTPIKAAAAGVVSNAEWINGPKGGFGKAVVIVHSHNGQTYSTVYAHLSGYAVSKGQVVSAGQTIGYMGTTGNSTGPHLHFELHKGGYELNGVNAVNPNNYLITPF